MPNLVTRVKHSIIHLTRSYNQTSFQNTYPNDFYFGFEVNKNRLIIFDKFDVQFDSNPNCKRDNDVNAKKLIKIYSERSIFVYSALFANDYEFYRTQLSVVVRQNRSIL